MSRDRQIRKLSTRQEPGEYLPLGLLRALIIVALLVAGNILFVVSVPGGTLAR